MPLKCSKNANIINVQKPNQRQQKRVQIRRV